MTTTRRGRSASLIAGNEDEVRMERVHEIRQAVVAGGFEPCDERLAAAMIAAALVQGREQE